ncbi:ras-related protein Rab-20-like [Ptychodera flava]|uniref:ras-related protein Rab-20-like n=1 Tax=Ptychodera flava TaxID=63121 RepID=UPI00396A7F1E
MVTEEMATTPKKKADLKVVIIGDMSVGKSTLIQRYLSGKFQDTLSQTIGAAFFLKQWGPYNIAIWDTAGEEKFSGLSSFYCRNARAAIMAYDISERESFDSLYARHLPLLQQGAEEDCLVIAVGTKLDLVTPNTREVTNEEGEKFAYDANPSRFQDGTRTDLRIPFYETSSVTGENVDNVFTYIFKTLLPLDPEGNPIEPNAARKRSPDVVDLENPSNAGNAGKSSKESERLPPQGKKAGCC